jgi:hypothetical protein
MSNGIRVEVDQFEKLESSAQNVILFQNTEQILNILETHQAVCNKRFKSLEERKRFDTKIGAGSGFVGGMLTILASKIPFIRDLFL